MRKLVIIPTYNECENVERIVGRVMSLPEKFDVLVVDDSSPDGTADIVRGLQAAYPARLHLLEREGKSGLGSAYIAGFRWALERKYDYIFEMDADFSHNPDDLVRLYRAAVGQDGGPGVGGPGVGAGDGGRVDKGDGVGGADVVIGSRYISGVNVVNWPMSRLLVSWFASRYVHVATGMPVRDATAGFVGYSREVLGAIDLDAVRMKGYGFQIEMKYRAWRLGFRIREVSIIFVDRTAGTSKMSGGIFGEALWGVLGLRFRRIRRLGTVNGMSR